MPRNASGTYTLPSGNPVVSGTLIDATWANNTMADLGNEVTDSLSRSGEGAMLAPLRITDGVQATPSLAFSNEPSSGLYRAGTNEWWSVAAGVQVQQHTSTGAVTRFAAGAVGTPSVSAFNDVNTGIWFPAADTLAVSTAGVEALRVNSSGVLSLVNNPTLSGGTANGVLFLNGSKVATSGSALTFDGTNFASTGIITSTNINGVRAQYPVSASYYAQLDSRDGNTYLSAVGNTASILFRATDGGGTTAEGMRLTSTGLGIGTASPAAKLHVSGQSRVADSSNAANYMTFGVGANAPFGNASISTTTAGLSIVAEGAGNMTFLNNGSEAMRIDTANNLGIGVTPSAWATAGAQKALEVSLAGLSYYGAGNTVSRLTHNAYFDGTNWKYVATNVGATRYDMTGANAGSTHAWFTSVGGTANTTISFTQAMTLDASGNLLLGGTSAAQLDGVFGQIIGSSTKSNAGIAFETQYGAYMLYTEIADALIFWDSGDNAERGRFTSGGYFKASNTGTYANSTAAYHELRTSAADYSAMTSNSNASPYGAYFWFSAADPNNTTNLFLLCNGWNGSTNVTRATIRSNGGLANYQSNNVDLSDARTKKDIAPAASMWDKIGALEIVTYKYNDQTHDDVNVGVIAQQVESVEPVWVDADGFGDTPEDGVPLKTVYTKDITFAAIKALQEAMARIESLEADMAALKGAK